MGKWSLDPRLGCISVFLLAGIACGGSSAPPASSSTGQAGGTSNAGSSGSGGGESSSGSPTTGGSVSGGSTTASSGSGSSGSSSATGSSANGSAETTGSPTGGSAGGPVYGDPHQGTFNNGPVDFAESVWHNACSPYPQQIQDLTGDLLGGVAREFAEAGGLCDACILVTTPAGKSIIARLVTYGDENAPGDIDLSPQAYAALDGNDNGARPMTWQLAECPDTGTIRYQFQTEANVYWTSLWVRNARVPIAKVEVKSTNHPTFFELTRGTDGTLTDAGGFGDGAFTLQITGMDGQVITDTFDSFQPGQVIVSTKQFQ